MSLGTADGRSVRQTLATEGSVRGRVAPHVARAFEAGPDGLEFLATGPHRPGDGELVDDPWVK
jgi:hypothetical protein